MVFSSIIFLCGFMPAFFFIYYICPAKLRNLLLLLASLLFYAWGEPRYILIMLFSTVFDYFNGIMIESLKSQCRQAAAKLFLVISVVGNIGILGFFKYTDFFINNINQLCEKNISLVGIALPIGISFYTFQTMSYSIDVYRGEIKAQKNIINFAMYVSMFPQLIAGPIVRYSQIEKNIVNRKISMEKCAQGLFKFSIGLGKKVILANQAGDLWNTVLATSTGERSVALAWLGAIAYTFQIYFDFSGYSDMAIGMGQMLGFEFPKNFNYPYISKSITEFWRRWHISLSSWFREYVYIPLGGNRKGMVRQIINLFVVWFLTGLWHGASWNFVVWGLYYFILLIIEKWFMGRQLAKMPKIISGLYTMFFVIVGWVIFACDDMGTIGDFIKNMFGVNTVFVNEAAIYQWYTSIIMIVVMVVASSGISEKIWGKIKEKSTICSSDIPAMIYSVVLIIVSLAMLVNGSYNPFLYFRF